MAISLLDAKATLSIEVCVAKMFVLKEKDDGTVYVANDVQTS